MTHRATVRVRFEADEPTAVVEVAVHGTPDGLDAGLAALVAHVFRWHDCIRVVTFVGATDRPLQEVWERSGLRAVAVDGDELLYHTRNPLPGVSPRGPAGPP